MHTPDEPLANLLFEFRGADIILRSHDNQHFRVPKCYIVNSSPVLDELIQDALDAPEDAHGEAQLPVVQLPASGEILRNLLTFIFPVTSVLPSSAEEIMELLSVANKYQMVSVMDHIRNKATTEHKLFPRRETTLVVFSLARTYRLPFEALRAAEDSVNYPMAIEDLEDELAIIPGASLYDLWKYHEKFRAILASDLETFRKSGARGTLTGLQCTESSSSHIPRWVDTYIKSTRKSPRPISFVEFTIALVRHIGDGARGNGCACASITTQTILNFWKTLTSVYQKSLRKVCVADVTKLTMSQSLFRHHWFYIFGRSETIPNPESIRLHLYQNLWTYTTRTLSSAHPTMSTSASISHYWPWCRLSLEIGFPFSNFQIANQSMNFPWFNCPKTQNC